MTDEVGNGKFCTECGKEIHAKAEICPHCGVRQMLQGSGAAALGTTIPNYLVPSILVTLFCCLPFGIVSIVYAAQVNSKEQAGDLQGALNASRLAKRWILASLGSGLVVLLLYVGVVVAAVILGS